MSTPTDTVFEDLHGNPVPEEVHVDTPSNEPLLVEGLGDEIPEEVVVDVDGDKSGGKDDKFLTDDEDDDGPVRARSYSQNVRDRIAREQRVTQRERNARLAAEQAAATLYEGMRALHTEHKKLAVATIDRDVEFTRRELAQAVEEGDSDKQAKANERMASLMADRKAAEMAEFNIPQPQSAQVENDALSDWKLDKGWYDRPTNHKQLTAKQTYMLIDQEMASEGFKAPTSSPEWFKELDRRFALQRPDLYREISGKEPPVERQQQRQPAPRRTQVMGVRRDAGGARSSRVVLTKDDLANMTRFKLDPRNPDHLRQYAAEKRALASKEN
jgi:hypothetical protein